MSDIVFVTGKRTAFGAFGGSLKDVSATDLMVSCSQAALKELEIDAKHIDHVVVGNVVQSGSDAPYLSRHVALKVGAKVETPAYNVNRLCGSGFQSWINAFEMIRANQASFVLAGGVEQMSQVPYVMRQVRFSGIRMGHGKLEDYMTEALTDAYVQMPMAMTAEKLGESYGITREMCDEYSYQSQMRYKNALAKNYFAAEISPLVISSKKGEEMINKDEHPKPDVSFEKIQGMKPLFKKDGLVTAATASGIVDGAATSLITDLETAKKLNLKPRARILSYASVGCDPSIMGIGPAQAIRKCLAQASLTLDQMDLVEVNEAFAAQYLSVQKELNLNPERTNVNGGAIAVGHPLGASGTRIMNHLVFELERRSARYAIGSACIGGGQGIAILIERM